MEYKETVKDGKKIHYGVTFISANRHISHVHFVKVASEICRREGINQTFITKDAVMKSNITIGNDYLSSYVFRELDKKNL